MRRLMVGVGIIAAMFIIPQQGLADCPDEAECSLEWVTGFHSADSKKLGVIKTPTCYTFGKGCRPWHCSGYKDTNSAYWINKCITLYNVKHESSRTSERVCVYFKGGINAETYCKSLE